MRSARRAAQLGCYNTNFVNPNELHDDNHYTTAYDMSLITREAMKNPAFRELVTKENYTLQPTNKQPEQRHFWLSNWLTFETRYQIEGADGVKTGFTDEAHHTIVGSAVRGDTSLMVVLLSEPTKVDMFFYHLIYKLSFDRKIHNNFYTIFYKKQKYVPALNYFSKDTPL